MPAKRELDPTESMFDLAAVTLHRLRIDRSQSLQAVADLLGVHRSNVARVESGEIKLQEKHAEKIDRAWNTGGILTAIIHHAKTHHDTSWLSERADLEARATHIKAWSLGWVYGLFQTESYARAQLMCADLDDVEEGVRARLKRQETLSKPKPPFVRAYLDQSVIERPVGGFEIQREQLARLLEVAQLPRVTVRVVPADSGAHVGRDGSFHIMAVDGTDVAFTETIGPGRLIRDVSEVRASAQWFERIGDVALPTRASLDLIRRTMEGLT